MDPGACASQQTTTFNTSCSKSTAKLQVSAMSSWIIIGFQILPGQSTSRLQRLDWEMASAQHGLFWTLHFGQGSTLCSLCLQKGTANPISLSSHFGVHRSQVPTSGLSVLVTAGNLKTQCFFSSGREPAPESMGKGEGSQLSG